MNETAPDDWKARALKLLEDGMSQREVGNAVGRATQTIQKLAYQNGLTRAANGDKGGRRPLSAYPILSQQHRALGVRLNSHREIHLKWNLDQMARHLGANRLSVQLMELGKFDFTLTQLSTLSDLLGLPLADLVTPFTPTTVATANQRAI